MIRPSAAISRKLEESRAVEAIADGSPPRDPSLFMEQPFDRSNAERIGYSNYSYWGSTFRAFLKRPIAVILLCVLAALIAFTFIQPKLPGQYPATLIINHPLTKRQLSSVPPTLSTVLTTAGEGTLLTVRPYDDPEWAAVTNLVSVIQRRTKFTVLEYAGDWLRARVGDDEGWIANDFANKLKLPDDPAAVPYESQSNFPVNMFLSPNDYTSAGNELFARRSDLLIDETGGSAVTIRETPLRILPYQNGFWFGTNLIGQDLWALVWSGTRTSLFIGFMVALMEAGIGILIGIVWGYVRRLDRILTEIYNVLDNIPTTIVLILVSYIMRPSVRTLIFAMCLTTWVGMARFIRNQIVIIRDRDYNLASRCLGTPLPRVIVRNLLPYLVSVIMLRMALAIPSAIGSEVFITYIGLGLPVSVPSLGNLINEGRKLLSTSQSYQLVFPTIVLSIITISFYMIGNAFADSADPKNHR
jgi:ABC-type dipeptide/oligopeptide/nickel transport system permease subunit